MLSNPTLSSSLLASPPSQDSLLPALLPANPWSNTGLDSQATSTSTSSSPSSSLSWYARPDWLQGVRETAKIADFLFLVGELERILKTSFDIRWGEHRTIGIKWDGYAISPLGALVCYRLAEHSNSTAPSEDSLCSIWFSLPGECWSTSTAEQHNLLINLIPRFNFRVTRLDLALDDYSRRLKFNDVINAVKNGNFSGAKNYYIHESGQRDKEETGVAVVLGSASSDKRLTIYDKAIESKGKINSIRLELRLRDELSDNVYRYLFEREFRPLDVAACILGSVKFLNRTKQDKNLDRLPLLKWWQSFIEYLEATPFKINRPKVVRHVESTVNWLCRQVSSSLAVLSRVMGDRLVSKLLSIGNIRYKRSNWYRALEKSFRYNLEDLIAAFEKHIPVEPSLPGDGSRYDWDYGWVPAKEQEREEVLEDDSDSSLESPSLPLQSPIPGLDLEIPSLPKDGPIPPWVWEMQ